MGSKKDEVLVPAESKKGEALDEAGFRGLDKVDLNLDMLPPSAPIFDRMLILFGDVANRALLVTRNALKNESNREQKKPRLNTVIDWNDLLPPGLRKQTAKMLADQQAHIAELDAKKRYRAAQWQVWCTYTLWVWYIAARPVSILIQTLLGKVGGA